jgi:hypothetical protein
MGCAWGPTKIFFHLAREQGYYVIGHPGHNEKQIPYGRALIKCDVELQPKRYYARDRDLVDNSELLIGTPCTDKPIPRSGTWYTIQYALDKQKPVIIVFSSGKAEELVCNQLHGHNLLTVL